LIITISKTSLITFFLQIDYLLHISY